MYQSKTSVQKSRKWETFAIMQKMPLPLRSVAGHMITFFSIIRLAFSTMQTIIEGNRCLEVLENITDMLPSNSFSSDASKGVVSV
jgi:hypothetical protein